MSAGTVKARCTNVNSFEDYEQVAFAIVDPNDLSKVIGNANFRVNEGDTKFGKYATKKHYTFTVTEVKES